HPGTTINQLIQHCTNPSHIKTFTNCANIYAIEQLTNHTNTELLTWHQLAYKTQKIIPGRLPKWFLELHNTLLKPTTPHISTVSPNPFTTNKIIPTRTSWILGKFQNTPIIGKVFKTKLPKNNIQITHWLPPALDTNISPLTNCTSCILTTAINTHGQ
ncbi:6507_t:CDS:1, partial [Ambispora leptoticha]